MFVYVHQGCALLESGRLRDAELLLRQSWNLARDTTGPNTETEAVAAHGKALGMADNEILSFMNLRGNTKGMTVEQVLKEMEAWNMSS